MKIALIGTTAACVIGFRADLIKALVAEGHTVYAFALDYTETSKAQVSLLGAEPVDYKFSRAGLNPVFDILNTLKLSIKLRSLSLDVVFSYFAKPVIFGTFAASVAGVKRRIAMLEGLGFVFTEHPNGVTLKVKILRKIQVFLYRCALPFVERIIFLNPDDPVDLLTKYGLTAKRVSVLGGIGLNLADYAYSVPMQTPFSFIFVGRLLAEKGVHEYVNAARLVKQLYPDVRFVMLGGLDEDNPGGLSVTELAGLKREDLVVHPGHVSDVVAWLNSSSVFVLPSYREGVPRSTQEAMAIGRAIITTDVPGCRETVVDGVNGFLVKPWSAEDLAKKMMIFLASPDLALSMGLESRRIAQENFDSVKVNKTLVGYFHNVATSADDV